MFGPPFFLPCDFLLDTLSAGSDHITSSNIPQSAAPKKPSGGGAGASSSSAAPQSAAPKKPSSVASSSAAPQSVVPQSPAPNNAGKKPPWVKTAPYHGPYHGAPGQNYHKGGALRGSGCWGGGCWGKAGGDFSWPGDHSWNNPEYNWGKKARWGKKGDSGVEAVGWRGMPGKGEAVLGGGCSVGDGSAVWGESSAPSSKESAAKKEQQDGKQITIKSLPFAADLSQIRKDFSDFGAILRFFPWKVRKNAQSGPRFRW